MGPPWSTGVMILFWEHFWQVPQGRKTQNKPRMASLAGNISGWHIQTRSHCLRQTMLKRSPFATGRPRTVQKHQAAERAPRLRWTQSKMGWCGNEGQGGEPSARTHTQLNTSQHNTTLGKLHQEESALQRFQASDGTGLCPTEHFYPRCFVLKLSIL